MTAIEVRHSLKQIAVVVRSYRDRGHSPLLQNFGPS